jgi:DNA-binding NarL/FixJ family response regulator
MSNQIIDPFHQEISKDAIILIDDEPLSQDCLAQAMRGAFPQAIILSAPTVDELPRSNGASIALVLLKVKPHPMMRDELAGYIRSISRYLPKVPVVLITTGDDAFSVGMAIAAGAQGVIPVTASLKIAVAAVQLVMAGGTYYPRPAIEDIQLREDMHVREDTSGAQTAAAFAMTSPLQPRAPSFLGPMSLEGKEPLRPDDPHGLVAIFTAREADVLAALQMGRSNKWIAHHLNLSENTIKVHIRHIMRKLHATNRTEAVVLSQHLSATLHGV